MLKCTSHTNSRRTVSLWSNTIYGGQHTNYHLIWYDHRVTARRLIVLEVWQMIMTPYFGQFVVPLKKYLKDTPFQSITQLMSDYKNKFYRIFYRWWSGRVQELLNILKHNPSVKKADESYNSRTNSRRTAPLWLYHIIYKAVNRQLFTIYMV